MCNVRIAGSSFVYCTTTLVSPQVLLQLTEAGTEMKTEADSQLLPCQDIFLWETTLNHKELYIKIIIIK